MALQHFDEAVLEAHDPLLLGAVDLLAGLLVDVRLVGRDAEVGDATIYGEFCNCVSKYCFITTFYEMLQAPLNCSR